VRENLNIAEKNLNEVEKNKMSTKQVPEVEAKRYGLRNSKYRNE